MEFTLKKGIDISERDLESHAVWSSFYEPDEFELLEELGFDLDEVKNKLDKVHNIDDYWFPLPKSAASMPVKYIYVSAKIKTPRGTELLGYRTRVSLTIVLNNSKFHFNRAARSLSIEQANELASVLKEKNIFPLSVHLPALERDEEFTI